jgi:hypothetical protein
VLSDPRFEVRRDPERTEHDLARVVGDAEILVTRAYNDVTRRVLDAAPNLRVIAQGTSGTDNIDEATARERGITVISLPGGNANAVAELVLGFMIALTRTVPFYDRQMRDGIWQRDDSQPATSSPTFASASSGWARLAVAWRDSLPRSRCASRRSILILTTRHSPNAAQRVLCRSMSYSPRLTSSRCTFRSMAKRRA